jgi:hypothetical protein
LKFASEALILGGAYCGSFNLALAIVMICLGCLAAVFRFMVFFALQDKKEQLVTLLLAFARKIVEMPTYAFDMSQFQPEKKDVH